MTNEYALVQQYKSIYLKFSESRNMLALSKGDTSGKNGDSKWRIPRFHIFLKFLK